MHASVKQNVPACLIHKPKHKDDQHSLYQSQEQTTILNVGLRAVMQNVTHPTEASECSFFYSGL